MSQTPKTALTNAPAESESEMKKSDVTSSNQRPEKAKKAAQTDKEKTATPGESRDLTLTHKEAQAGGPEDMAACGEEDIGAGLEFLVTRHDDDK